MDDEEMEIIKHANAVMAGDFAAISAMLNEVDVPDSPDGVVGRVRLLVDRVKGGNHAADSTVG